MVPIGASVADHVESRGWPLIEHYNDNPRVPPPPADTAFWESAPPFFQVRSERHCLSLHSRCHSTKDCLMLVVPQSRNYRHDIRHPIHAPCMSELITAPQVRTFRHCSNADTPSASLWKHLLKSEGGAAERQY